MKKTALTIICLFCICLVLHAQKPSITGVIIDNQKLSLPGATIKLTPGNRYTISDVYGKFEILNLPIGTEFNIEVSYIGYSNYNHSFTLKPNEKKYLTIQLGEQATSNSEIVVFGDRRSGQAKALNQQKNNINISNIVSADQVGRFPDDNIGDAIKRIPGITMQNDQGEARNIIVRGLASELNSVTLNGDRIPSAEGDNRKVQMDLIPSDMVQTIEVNKTLTSDMDADAIGGSVNLVTRAAPNGQRISATLAGGFNPIRDKGAYTGSLVYGNRFAKNKLGIVLSGSIRSNNFGSDNVEAVWAKDDFDNVYIEEHDIRKYDVKRIRRSFSGAFDYKIDARNQLSFNAMYNWRDDWENRFRARTRGIEPIYDAADNIIGYEGKVRRQTKGGINNNRVQSKRLEEQKVQRYALKGDHLLGGLVDMDWGVGFARASEYRPNERYIEYQSGTLEFENFGTPEQPIFTPVVPEDHDGYKLREITENTNNTFEDEVNAKINFRLPASIIQNQKGRLRFGAKLRIKNKERVNNWFEYNPTNDDYKNLTSSGVVLQSFDGQNWQPNSKYVPGFFFSKNKLGQLQLNDAGLFEKEDVPSEYLSLNYSAKENIVSEYIRWDQDINSSLTFIAGLRAEHTNINYKANVVVDEDELEGQRTIKNNYTNLFPSLAIKYNAQKNLVLRAAITTSTARPNYYSLSPYVGIIADDQEINAGNAQLKASYAWNYDVMAEYYFKSVGILSGGVFYKKINNFIYRHRDEAFSSDKFTTYFPDLENPVPAGENWLLTQDRNGEHVNVYGFELALQRQLDFLPGKFLKHLGIYSNYTFTKSKAKGIYSLDGERREDVMLPGTSPHMFNASLSWENKVFSARISLNYSAAYIDELGGDAFYDRFYDKQTFVDANASYKFAKHFRVFVEANNLSNQPLRYYQGVSNRTMQMEYYKPKYNLGFKFDLTK